MINNDGNYSLHLVILNHVNYGDINLQKVRIIIIVKK